MQLFYTCYNLWYPPPYTISPCLSRIIEFCDSANQRVNAMWTLRSQEFCHRLGLRLPIIQAPMAGGPTTPSLVSAVAQAGALGSIGAGYLKPDQLASEIETVQSMTDRPFSVNIFVLPDRPHGEPSAVAQGELQNLARTAGVETLDFAPQVTDYIEDHLEVCIQRKVPVVSFVFGLPDTSQVRRLKQAGISIIGTASNRAEVEVMQRNECDFITLQGAEAGGHRGGLADDTPTIGLMSLLERNRDCTVPLIAAGGIRSGFGIISSLVAGASAVQMGSAFLAVEESGAEEVWKQSVRMSTDTSTTFTRAFSGKRARGITNRFMEQMSPFEGELAPFPLQNAITTPIRRAARLQGNPDLMSMWCGQSGGREQRLTAAALLAILESEAKSAIESIRQFKIY